MNTPRHVPCLRAQPNTPDFCREETTLAAPCTEISLSLGVTLALMSVSSINEEAMAASISEDELAAAVWAVRAERDADSAALASALS